MVTVDIMMGLIGSGKSTLAKQLAQEKGAIILSSDSIRKELVDSGKLPAIYDTKTNQIVYNELHKRLEESLKHKQNVIVDGINSIKREDYFAITKKYECYVVGRLLLTDKTICLQRVREREKNDSNIHKIENPEKVAKFQIDEFKRNFPSLDEGFDELVIYKNNVISSVKKKGEA